MSKHVKKPLFTFISVVLCSILLTGCIIHVGSGKATASTEWGDNYSSVNKSLTIDSGKTVGNVSAVNGSLTIENGVTAEKVSSVNGRLRVGKNVSAQELSTVNGKLTAKENLQVSGEVTSVNGTISIDKNASIGESISTVNGTILLESVVVKQNIETVNGDIALTGNTSVHGDIIYKWNKNNSKYRGKHPTLEIEKDAVVKGRIILERPVELNFADESLHEKVERTY